ncbi:protein shisa-6 homolog [Carlito syrichta]|uniref:Protein shisa-6 homolog n=3 Tax=Haplorrhini TaxID=376913 RepID=A0A3Q0EHJ7_CARSF|nr:protein shisa-6 homolog [Carlito syrichta]
MVLRASDVCSSLFQEEDKCPGEWELRRPSGLRKDQDLPLVSILFIPRFPEEEDSAFWNGIPVSPLGRGKGLQKPQLPFRQRAARGSSRVGPAARGNGRGGLALLRSGFGEHIPVLLRVSSLPAWFAVLINWCAGFRDAKLQVLRGEGGAEKQKRSPPRLWAPRRVNVGGGEPLSSPPLSSLPHGAPVCGCAAAAAASAAVTYETCWGYYDVSGQYDKEFECNNSESGYLYCCGTCYYRFCCKKRHEKLDQRQCTNYQSPVWVQTPSTKVVSPGPENKYDPEKDKTNFTVYITCGVIAFVIVAGVFAKVSYDKAHRPPREMNIHRALADILRQQGPIPIAHCERETISAIDTSPKENTPVRSSSKNHYTPVRTAKQTPGHYGKDAYRSGGPDLHNFISSGFVTLGRGHTKGTVETIFY